ARRERVVEQGTARPDELDDDGRDGRQEDEGDEVAAVGPGGGPGRRGLRCAHEGRRYRAVGVIRTTRSGLPCQTGGSAATARHHLGARGGEDVETTADIDRHAAGADDAPAATGSERIGHWV